MKLLVFIFLFMVSGCSVAKEFDRFDVLNNKIYLNKNCNLVISNSKVNDYELKIDFEAPKECRIVTHPNTSLISTHYINNGYILFVENNHVDVDECYSEYTAFKVEKNGNIKISPLIKKSGSCFQGREIKDFEYFSAKIVH